MIAAISHHNPPCVDAHTHTHTHLFEVKLVFKKVDACSIVNGNLGSEPSDVQLTDPYAHK